MVQGGPSSALSSLYGDIREMALLTHHRPLRVEMRTQGGQVSTDADTFTGGTLSPALVARATQHPWKCKGFPRKLLLGPGTACKAGVGIALGSSQPHLSLLAAPCNSQQQK